MNLEPDITAGGAACLNAPAPDPPAEQVHDCRRVQQLLIDLWVSGGSSTDLVQRAGLAVGFEQVQAAVVVWDVGSIRLVAIALFVLDADFASQPQSAISPVAKAFFPQVSLDWTIPETPLRQPVCLGYSFF